MNQAITIYTKTSCSYCHMAKNLLAKLNLSYNEVSVDNNHSLRERLRQENGGYSTVPMIFIKDKFIGGYTDLADLVSENKLQQYL